MISRFEKKEEGKKEEEDPLPPDSCLDKAVTTVIHAHIIHCVMLFFLLKTVILITTISTNRCTLTLVIMYAHNQINTPLNYDVAGTFALRESGEREETSPE